MQRHFFITGFPRSRSSWLANWLTTGPSFCHHDGLRGCAELPQFHRKMRMKGRDHVGDADSGLLFFVDDVAREFPEARWVVVVRPKKAALAGFAKAFPGTFTPEHLVAAFDLMEKTLRELTIKPLVVTFDELDEEATARKVWAHCLPGVEFDLPRWKMLNILRVEPHQEKYDFREAKTEMVHLAKSLATLKGP